MRPQRPLLSAALAAALLLGQWLGAAHDTDHGLKPGAGHACAVCVYSHGGGAGLLPASVRLEIAGAATAPEAVCAARPIAAALRHHPIRGPPALLV